MISQIEKDIKRVTLDGMQLEYIFDQTPEMCLAAVKENGLALEFVQSQTREISLAAVENVGFAICYVKNQTSEIMLTAIMKNGFAIQSIIDQTPELSLAAVTQDGMSLRYINEQTHEIALAAVSQNGLSLAYVINKTPEIALAAVLNHGYALKYVTHQTPEIIIAATSSILAPIEYAKGIEDEVTLSLFSRHGFDFINIAARLGLSDTFKTLIKNNVPVDCVQYKDSSTAFEIAALNFKTETVQVLFDGGANIHFEMGDCKENILSYIITSLEEKDIKEAIPTIVTLLNIGIDPLEKDSDGKNAMMLAKNIPEILNILKAFNLKKLVASTIEKPTGFSAKKSTYF
jgi:hypothetical protein